MRQKTADATLQWGYPERPRGARSGEAHVRHHGARPSTQRSWESCHPRTAASRVTGSSSCRSGLLPPAPRHASPAMGGWPNVLGSTSVRREGPFASRLQFPPGVERSASLPAPDSESFSWPVDMYPAFSGTTLNAGRKQFPWQPDSKTHREVRPGQGGFCATCEHECKDVVVKRPTRCPYVVFLDSYRRSR